MENYPTMARRPANKKSTKSSSGNRSRGGAPARGGKNKSGSGKKFNSSRPYKKRKPKMLPKADKGKFNKAPQKEDKKQPDDNRLMLGCPQWRMEKESPALMRKILSDCDIAVNDLQLNLLWQYYLRVKERNKEINITRIHKFDDFVVKHFVDCIIVGKLTKLPSPLLDLGSGGGFPGVPLKIMHPDTEIILGEGRRLRVEFLQEVRKCLRLPKLYIHGNQIHPSYTEKVGGVVTRAVEIVQKTLVRVSGCVPVGGRVILMKGPKVTEEIKETKKILSRQWKLAEDHDFTLPGTDHNRRVVVYERIALED
jgi:16S rRNA (guanine(527)-N(7))-methyltransferase RsmG